MAILAIMSGNLKKAEYEIVRKEVNWEEMPAKGGIFYAAAFHDQGNLHVSDIWASQAELQDFLEKRLGPTMAKHKFTPPEMAIYPIQTAHAFPKVMDFLV